MSLYGRFPVHTHATVVCFNCGASVPSTGESEGDAPGHGQFVSLRCAYCTMRTWYDILTNRTLLEGAGDACTTILGARLVMHAHEYLLKQGRLDVD